MGARVHFPADALRRVGEDLGVDVVEHGRLGRQLLADVFRADEDALEVHPLALHAHDHLDRLRDVRERLGDMCIPYTYTYNNMQASPTRLERLLRTTYYLLLTTYSTSY